MFVILKRIHFFGVICALVSIVAAIGNKYCQLPCDFVDRTVTHTVCDRDYEKCGPDTKCGPNFKEIKLNNDDRQYIVDIHNYLRNKVALGYEKRGHQPTASNMNVMSYSMEMEYIAQCWANACNGNPLKHDTCRRTEEYGHVGQNLGFTNSSSTQISLVKSIKDLTLLWYDEVEYFNRTWINDTRDRGVKVGHYTQLLWADSAEIGCAATYYTTTPANRTWHHLLLVCNYGPGGNYINREVYKVGKPCSKCSAGLKQNKKYKGLCGTIKNLNVDQKFSSALVGPEVEKNNSISTAI